MTSTSGTENAAAMLGEMNLGPHHGHQYQQQHQQLYQSSGAPPPPSGSSENAFALLPAGATAAPPSGSRRHVKRQMSAGTYALNTPSEYDLKLQRVGNLGARKPGVVPKMWSSAEDTALQASVAVHGEKNWRRIAEDIPGRTHLQCLQRWKKALRPGLIKGQWSRDEDEMLLRLLEPARSTEGGLDAVNWASIAQQIDGRNAKQCRERWNLNLDPSINRGPWTSDEDDRLLRLAAECDGRWALISKNMPGRTENSVKTRFHSLQRQLARVRGWTQQEDDTLLHTVQLVGRDWAKVVKQLPGRSKGQAKKRFSTLAAQRPDVLVTVQRLEAQIAAGMLAPPNPPPAPVVRAGPAFAVVASRRQMGSNGAGFAQGAGPAPAPYGPRNLSTSSSAYASNASMGVPAMNWDEGELDQFVMPAAAQTGNGWQEQQQQQQHYEEPGASPPLPPRKTLSRGLDSSDWGETLPEASPANAPVERTLSQRIIGEWIHRSDGREAEASSSDTETLEQQGQQQPSLGSAVPMSSRRPDTAAQVKLEELLSGGNSSNSSTNVDSSSPWDPAPAALPPPLQGSNGGFNNSNGGSNRSLRSYTSWGSSTGGGPEFAALFSNEVNDTSQSNGSGSGAAQPPVAQQQQQHVATSPRRRLQKAASSSMSIGLGAINHTLNTYDSATLLSNLGL